MMILRWNLRDSYRGGFSTQLRDLLKVHTPDITILMEAKVSSHRATKLFKI